MEWDSFGQNPLLIIVWFTVPFLMFSLVQTKCHWYVKPLYPVLGILIGWLLAGVIKPLFPKKKFYMILLVSLLVISEILMIGVVFYKIQEAGPDQQILTKINSDSYPKKTAIFEVNWRQSPYQAQVFIAEVLKGFKPYSIADNNAFISKSKKNDLLLMPNDLANENFVKQYHLKIINRNQAWLLGRK